MFHLKETCLLLKPLLLCGKLLIGYRTLFTLCQMKSNLITKRNSTGNIQTLVQLHLLVVERNHVVSQAINNEIDGHKALQESHLMPKLTIVQINR